MDTRLLGRACTGAVLALVCGTAAADDSEAWTCTQDGLVREVTIYYPDFPARLPCQVFYTKRHENALPRPLWTASREAGYCERKAAGFVERLRSLGWQCSSVSDTATESGR